MKNQTKITAMLLVFIAIPLSVSAQDFSERIGIGFHGAAVKMVLGRADRSTVDQWAGLSFHYGLTSSWVISLNGAYGWVYPRDPNGSQFASSGEGFKTLLLPLYFSTEAFLLPEKSFRPYVTFGAGLLQWDIRDIRGATSFFDQGVSKYGSKVNAAIVMGVGLQKLVTEKMALNWYFRWHQLLKGNEDTIGTGDDNRAVIELGLAVQFWGISNKDTDGDGIPDRWDLCPEQPEDYDGFKDEDGCPDLDNDNDGVEDIRDGCPDIPEDLDGFEDQDGCPDMDNDKDGIPDAKDKAPNEPEDFDGYEDNDGAPDPDNDGDGIPDEKDHCPNQAETFNQFEDEDGCPDQKPPLVEKGKSIILRGITFATGSAQLTGNAYATLDSVYEWLAQNSEIMLEIRGYTDSVGEWDFNLRLSQQRAETVKRYLVDRGIEPSRLKAIGFGEQHPIASNATEKGRAENRRIEFVRIK